MTGTPTNTHVAAFSGATAITDGGAIGTAAAANTGTSGATVPLNNTNNTSSGNNTHSGTETFSSTVNLSAQTASSPACTDGSKNLIAGPACSVGEQFITLSAATANAMIGTLPANATITKAIAHETAGHPVSISLGSTSGATDVAGVTPIPIAASGQVQITAASFTKEWFSPSATQSVFIDSTSWGSPAASVNISIYYVVGP